MTKENLEKLYKHFCFLVAGKFTSRDFDVEYAAIDPENSGSTHMGKMSSQRVALIISDAKRHKEDMEKKNPWLVQAPVKEIKPKEKK